MKAKTKTKAKGKGKVSDPKGKVTVNPPPKAKVTVNPPPERKVTVNPPSKGGVTDSSPKNDRGSKRTNSDMVEVTAPTDNTVAVMVNQIAEIPAVKTITSPDEFESTRAIYIRLRDIENKLIAREKELLEPVKETESRIKALFTPHKRTLNAILDTFSLELSRYANATEIARLKALESVNSDKRLKNVETIQNKREEIGNRLSGTMKLKKLVIDDPDVIPREFMVPDEKAIKEALNEGRKVKGAHLEEVLTVTATKNG